MKRPAILTTIVGMIALIAFSIFATACSSGPKVYSVGNSASRVTIEPAD